MATSMTEEEWEKGAYLIHLENLLSAALDQVGYMRGLFTQEELSLVSSFLNGGLVISSKALFTRLLQRKGPWFRVDSLLKYQRETKGDVSSVQFSLKELEDAGFIQGLTQQSCKDSTLEAIRCCLTVQELRELAKRLSANAKSGKVSKRSKLLVCIRDLMSNQRTLWNHKKLPVVQEIKRLLLPLVLQGDYTVDSKSIPYLLIKINLEKATLFRRVMRALYCTNISNAPITVYNSPVFCPGLLSYFGKMKFVPYTLDLRTPIFRSRKHFLFWEAAVELYWCLQQSLVEGDKQGHKGAASIAEEEDEGCDNPQWLEHTLGRLGIFEDLVVPVLLADDLVLPMELCLIAAGCMDAYIKEFGVRSPWRCLDALLDHNTDVSTVQVPVLHVKDRTPDFLLQFDPGWVLATIIWEGLAYLEKERLYKPAVQILHKLLMTDYTRHRRGRWWIRLVIDLEHLDESELGKRVCEVAIRDSDVGGGDRITLSKKLQRLNRAADKKKGSKSVGNNCGTSKIAHNKENKKPVKPEIICIDLDASEDEGEGEGVQECTIDWSDSKESIYLGILIRSDYQPKEDCIMGRRLDAEVGKKSRFIGHGDGDVCNVEELALQHYKEEGGWWGLHCEGSAVRILFSLLLWDVIFTPVPDVFQNPFQDSPLDLSFPFLFYENRKALIEDRLVVLSQGTARSLARDIKQAYESYYGLICRGCAWDRYEVHVLQAIGVALGSAGLATVFRPLCVNYKHFCGGMPDLILIRALDNGQVLPCNEWVSSDSNLDDGNNGGMHSPTQVLLDLVAKEGVKFEALMVEVKGPNDKLAERQRAWLQIMQEGGIMARVCKIHEGSKKLKRKMG